MTKGKSAMVSLSLPMQEAKKWCGDEGETTSMLHQDICNTDKADLRVKVGNQKYSYKRYVKKSERGWCGAMPEHKSVVRDREEKITIAFRVMQARSTATLKWLREATAGHRDRMGMT